MTYLDKVRAFVQEQRPVVLVLPSFPAKSPNLQKVLGPLPDLAEKMALRFLQSLCEEISQIYPPGARLVICSTGRIYSDLLSVPDEHVTAYSQALEALIEQLGSHSLAMFSVENALHGGHEKVRSRLIARYADPLEQVRVRAYQTASVRAVFNGLYRLILEDEESMHPERGPTKAMVRSKELACRMIQRGEAWSRLIEERFPEAMRLSIFPQLAHAEQLGIHLVPTRDPWLTPWHGVLLESGGAFTLVKRHEAERLNASLVWRDERPSHFVAPTSGA
jgi:pyoverdine/dityrosine biosynthesis protein Dit1